MTTFNIGDRVWTASQSDESKAYGVCDAREPWQGIVTKVLLNGLLSYRVCSVSTLLPQGYDDDPNASAHVDAKDVFATQEEAIARYWLDIQKDIEATRHKVACLQKRSVDVARHLVDHPTTNEVFRRTLRYHIKASEAELT